MLVSYKWLQDFLKLDEDPYQLSEKITRTGVEVANVKHPQAGLKKLVVGHIIDCTPIKGTHLNLTHVDVGDEEPRQIVCGAPNVAAGEDVIVALPGARIADNIKIKKGKLRGYESNGMICGLQEIGFADSVVPEKYADGIFLFPTNADLQPGQEVFDLLGMDDYIFDFDITPNRADTLSMEGAAYEVGAIIDESVKIEDVTLKADGSDWTNQLKVQVDSKLAPKFYLRKITNVNVGASPLWLQTRLWNAGIRPINNVVDVTNYVMLLTGQPLHTYDARAFESGQLIVRTAKAGEKLTLLNEREVELNPNDIVITNGDQPVMMAGVMGGLNSEIKDDTTDVILEAAIFDPTLVRKAALRHANRTEASSRYEKGVNYDATMRALNMAALLLRNDAAGTIAEGIITGSDKKPEAITVKTTVSYINKVLGTEISLSEMLHIFKRLDFKVEVAGEDLAVDIPARRWDISIPADLVEEVGRLYGYDNIKSTEPILPETRGGYSQTEEIIRRIKSVVQGQGLTEAISYSLTSSEKAVTYTKTPQPLVKVQMPLNSNRSTLRQNLLTGLIDATAYNMARKQNQLALYEQGRVYDFAGNTYNEHEHLAALYAGNVYWDNWQHENEQIDFYYVKGQLMNLLLAIGIDLNQVEYKAEPIAGMHPTRTAGIYIKGHYVGLIGMISHEITSANKAMNGNEIYGYELDLDKIIPIIINPKTISQAAPKFPAIDRDLSVLIDQKVTNQEISDLIKTNGGKYLVKLRVIDTYQGSHVAQEKKSITYRLTFLNREDTLTDEVVTKAMSTIIDCLQDKLKAEIR